ncbi:MAG: DNA polymerase III subunit delta' [Alphaproteobacteria bacterium]|nr:DNA polymerase III subunit delta' [Alphaproteobacteria bacterium]MDP6623570.1 DNA polymerase III subunit delta' [Alphaproteobacteria bacterium]
MSEAEALPAGLIPPRENPDLIGHEAAEQTLLRAWTGDRFAHAWMICGPRGIGKATLAYRFARFVLAGEGEGGLFGGPENLALDPEHAVFRRIVGGGHADFLAVERSVDEKSKKLRSEIVVGDVRRALPFFAQTAAEGGWRVAVVDCADEMNRNAANALLKVLEEPPQRGLLLLVSHAPGSLLATMRSRCRKLTLRPLTDDQVSSLVRRRFPDLEATEVEALVALAAGSPGRALGLAGEGGLELYRELLALLEGLPGSDVPALHKLGDRLARANGATAFQALMELLLGFLGRLVTMAASGQQPQEVVAGEGAMMRGLAARRGLDHWLEVWEKVGRLAASAEGANLDRKQVLLNVFSVLERALRGV